MKSFFFWRLLIVSVIVLLLANVVSLAAYTYVGKNAYVSMEMDKLEPTSELTLQMYKEYENGNIDYSSFNRLVEKQSAENNSAILITDAIGKIVILKYAGRDMEMNEYAAYFDSDIKTVLNGINLDNPNLILPNSEPAISRGTPIKNMYGDVVGTVFIIKETSQITSAFQRLSDILIFIIAIVLPVFVVLVIVSSKRISQPLTDMAKTAIEMSKGNFTVRADESSSGETGVLAKALNTLCENLSHTIYQLQNEKIQLNQILESFTDGVAAIDNNGRLTHYNPALKKMFGAVDVFEPIDLVPDKSIWDEFNEVLSEHEIHTVNYSTPGEKMLCISIVPIMTEDGLCMGAVGLFKDVTEFQRLEQTRRDYVANISHELRTPLTAIRGLVEPMADGLVKDPETQNRYYGIILHEVNRLSRLITDMLQLSRLQSGKEYMEISAVDVKELLEETYEGYRNEAGQKGIHLLLNVEDIPYAMTDRDRIEQILVILLDNAMRYTPEGGSIEISAISGSCIIVSVTDTGCGIPEEELKHLFERFYKVDKSRKDGGTGLGLSIAKQIIERLGEQITVESEVGKGTRFSFTLKKYVSNAIALGPSGEGTGINQDGVGAEMFVAASQTAQKTSDQNSFGKKVRTSFRKKRS